VSSFQEKPAGDGAWINGGFFVLEPAVLDLIEGDESSWESTPLMQLADEGSLCAYQHKGFWQAMDTLRDKNQLEDLWATGKPPWKVWE
jgi:glucose-1-phosphate cytidylyltransferase